MNRNYPFVLLIIAILGVIVLVSRFLQEGTIDVLRPMGTIASQQRDLIMIATALSLLVVVPVFILTFVICWKYRVGNTKARYSPEWDHNSKLEFSWWAIPGIIILILAAITWKSSHDLDPFKPLASTTQPMTIQVVALPWKWLFIYPDQQIATVNYVQFPEKTPIHFEITADAPMNSFWIPRLGGQIYAMAGMSTSLNLMADGVGSYRGSSANLSGEGFAGMHFMAQSTSRADFDAWTTTAQHTPASLSLDEYSMLAKPSQNNLPSVYGIAEPDLYNKIMMKYMAPTENGMHSMHAGGGG